MKPCFFSSSSSPANTANVFCRFYHLFPLLSPSSHNSASFLLFRAFSFLCVCVCCLFSLKKKKKLKNKEEEVEGKKNKNSDENKNNSSWLTFWKRKVLYTTACFGVSKQTPKQKKKVSERSEHKTNKTSKATLCCVVLLLRVSTTAQVSQRQAQTVVSVNVRLLVSLRFSFLMHVF